VALLGEYFRLARFLQPSMMVIEDVDLIARERAHLQTPGQEIMLNKLLNGTRPVKPSCAGPGCCGKGDPAQATAGFQFMGRSSAICCSGKSAIRRSTSQR